MDEKERIERLETTLATLIAWLSQDLGVDNTHKLLDMLSENKKAALRS